MRPPELKISKSVLLVEGLIFCLWGKGEVKANQQVHRSQIYDIFTSRTVPLRLSLGDVNL